MALLETLIDNFDDNSTDTGKWSIGWALFAEDTSVTVAEANARVEVTTFNGAGTLYRGYVSVNTYDLTGSYASVKVAQLTGGSASNTAMAVSADASNWYQMFTEAGTLYVQQRVGGSQSTIHSLAYNGTNHLYWRISESAGSVSADVSADGSSWNSLVTAATSQFAITAMTASIGAGTYSAQSATTAHFDNFNTSGAVGSAFPATYYQQMSK